MNEEESRIHSYLLSQGQKYSFMELLPRVIKARLVLLDEVNGHPSFKKLVDEGFTILTF